MYLLYDCLHFVSQTQGCYSILLNGNLRIWYELKVGACTKSCNSEPPPLCQVPTKPNTVCQALGLMTSSFLLSFYCCTFTEVHKEGPTI